MANYIVYSRDNCGYCTKALSLLDSKSLTTTEVDLMSDLQTFKEYFKTSFNIDIKTAPQIVLNDGKMEYYIGGYDALVKHLEVGGVLDVFCS